MERYLEEHLTKFAKAEKSSIKTFIRTVKHQVHEEVRRYQEEADTTELSHSLEEREWASSKAASLIYIMDL